jgi:hypothetical protein
VAAFHHRLFEVLRGLGIGVEIRATPFGVPVTTAFPDDTEHASYDRGFVERFWSALSFADWGLREFAGWFCGKSSPVHLFWHSLDLASARFSGRRAPTTPQADRVGREAYSHEVISFGFWAGDANTRFPAFYSYTAPEPQGLALRPLAPGEAYWKSTGSSHLALLPYEAVRVSGDPHATLLEFLSAAYAAGAGAAGWDEDALRSAFCPV